MFSVIANRRAGNIPLLTYCFLELWKILVENENILGLRICGIVLSNVVWKITEKYGVIFYMNNIQTAKTNLH